MFDWVSIRLCRVCENTHKTKFNSFCKVTGNKTLISVKQDSTREKI